MTATLNRFAKTCRTVHAVAADGRALCNAGIRLVGTTTEGVSCRNCFEIIRPKASDHAAG